MSYFTKTLKYFRSLIGLQQSRSKVSTNALPSSLRG